MRMSSKLGRAIHGLAVAAAMLTIAMGAEAAERWEFVHVSRSTTLHVYVGEGILERRGSRLSGKLGGGDAAAFYIDARISGSDVSAEFGSLNSDDGGTRMRGTFHQTAYPAARRNRCWQTIQLSDGYNSLTLARNAPDCEP